MVRSPQWIKRSADGSGDLNGAMGSVLLSLELNGALCVSLMMSTLVLTVDAMVICTQIRYMLESCKCSLVLLPFKLSSDGKL